MSARRLTLPSLPYLYGKPLLMCCPKCGHQLARVTRCDRNCTPVSSLGVCVTPAAAPCNGCPSEFSLALCRILITCEELNISRLACLPKGGLANRILAAEVTNIHSYGQLLKNSKKRLPPPELTQGAMAPLSEGEASVASCHGQLYSNLSVQIVTSALSASKNYWNLDSCKKTAQLLPGGGVYPRSHLFSQVQKSKSVLSKVFPISNNCLLVT